MLSKTSIKLTIASIKMYFRDKRALMFTVLVPIIIMSIFGVLDFTNTGKLKLGLVLPNDVNNQLKDVVENLKSGTSVEAYEGSYETELKQLEEDERDMILKFEPVFPSDSEVEKFVKDYLAGKISDYKTNCNISKPPSEEDIGCLSKEYVEINSKINVNALINTSSRQSAEFALLAIEQQFDQIAFERSEVKPVFYVKKEEVNVNRLTQLDFILPGLIGLTIMQQGLFGVAGAIVSYKEKGILKRIFATPLSKTDFLFSNVITRIIVGLIQIAVLFAYPKLANWIIANIKDIPLEQAQFHFTVVGNIGILLAVAFIGIIVFISMGFAISSFAKTFDQVQPIIMLVQFPMMFLSGVFFPKEALPNLVKKIADFFPLTYFVDGLRLIMNQGKDILEIGPELIGLSIWGILCFVIAIKVFKWD